MSFRVRLYLDLAPESDTFSVDVLGGLKQSPKSIPSKYFYDGRGSQLFDEICELDEYYLTRTEMAILEDNMGAITDRLGTSAILVEYGSGSSLKTRMLLDALPDADAYVPVDISRDHLLMASEHIQERYPNLRVLPVCADYSQPIPLNLVPTPGSRISVFFPGSTIGNFKPAEAVDFLSRLGDVVGPGGGVLLGVDLVKDEDVLRAAYNDASGVTAAFNRNVLIHANARLGADFQPERFDHEAIWNADASRIEMHLISREPHIVRIGEDAIELERGESILTEYSHKYTLTAFRDLVSEAGFEVDRVWTDDRSWFSLQYLVAGPRA
ncbi:MAG: L-histidine N(alpha)-methyltransferase [Rhodothermales bacterium]